MRPLKLVMEGFGTYCKKTVIDMQKLGSSGLYLITGDTGAGKTTIFDAITYALYGKVNGSDRKVSMVRTTFAGPETPTRVELTFAYNGNEYRVERNPEYERLSKRGEGVTKQPADATLYLPGGKTVNQDKKVTEAITELLRLDSEQFSQIVMIAQGEFRQLLMSKTEDKQEIFRKLFKTDCYEKLQIRLNEEEKALGNAVKQSKRDMNFYVKSVTCKPDDVLNLELEKAKNDELNVEDEIELTEKIIAQDEKEKASVEKDLLETQEKLDNIIKLLAQNEQIESVRKTKKQKENDKEQFETNYNNAKKNWEEQEKLKPGLKKDEENLTLKKQSLTDYDALDSLQKSIIKDNEALEKNKEMLASETENLQKLNEQKKTESDNLKNLSKADTEVITNEGKKEKLLEKQSKLEELQKFIVKNKEFEKIREDDVEAYKKAKRIYDDTYEEYKKKRSLFMDQQAGIMAEELEEGQPCPVCGSTSHPHPAVKTEEAPSQEELNNLEDAVSTANKNQQNAATDCAQSKKDCDNSLNNIQELQKKLFANWEPDKEQYISLLEKKCADELDALSEEYETVEKLLEDAKKAVEQKKAIENHLPKLDDKIKECEKTIQNYQNEISGLNASLKEKKKQEEALTKELEYKSKADAEAAIKELDNSIQERNKAYNEAKKSFDDANLALETVKSDIEQLKKQLEQWKPVDTMGKEEEQTALEDEKNSLMEQKTAVETRLSQNTSALQHMKETSDELIQTEKKYSWVSSLSKTANGNLTGNKEKIKLETYIQMTYFDKILAHANKRLMIMSDNQFELLRQRSSDNHKSQTGLELDVIDHYTGGVRSVKTLSGGESFQASLALALGLSDEVRISAGGIKIDSMFVDEGFGTLDTETQQKAYKALSTISEGNRLIGIISHVDLLKEKIDRQVVVKKERTGGSTVELMI